MSNEYVFLLKITTPLSVNCPQILNNIFVLPVAMPCNRMYELTQAAGNNRSKQ
jgi:hypothetical protein